MEGHHTFASGEKEQDKKQNSADRWSAIILPSIQPGYLGLDKCIRKPCGCKFSYI